MLRIVPTSYPFTRLSIIFPCFNEAENLARFDDEVFAYFARQNIPVECIFVDDGSSDDTWPVVEELMRRHPGTRAVRHPKNQGLGAAVRSGIAQATGDAILTLDADLTFSPSEAMKVISAYAPGIDCVIGSPRAGEFKDVPFLRRVLSDGVNTLYRFLLGRPITATSSILRLYRAGRLQSLVLQSMGFDINAEIIFRLISEGATIIEIPVVLTTRVKGVSKIRTAAEIKNHLKMFAKILEWKWSSRGPNRS